NAQYDQALENLDPAFKAEAYKRVIKEIGDSYNFSGSWSSGSVELFMMSTANNNTAYHIGTDQSFIVVLKHPEKKWELQQKQTGWRLEDFRVEEVVKKFKDLLPVYENITPCRLEPGEYTVALGGEALAEVLMMASYIGFYGRPYEEKQGWTAKNKKGDQIFNEAVTIVDEPSDDRTFGFGFDLTGKKRQTFSIVKNGMMQNLMYDSSTAAKYGRELTGHNTGSASIVLKPGKDPEDLFKAVSSLGKVVYIPALHYLNIPNASQGIFTGSSRFNAILIENGTVSGPIFSSRITDTFQSIFGNIKKISETSESINLSDTYGRRAPVAYSLPTYIVSEKIKITDSADSF
ncbi:MAG: metallopeptidase TldD-related protein, partial [Candidatus Riflebacteria bacterium]|nr:metallopeptidase TldD-related protein [Candidatus Riflebacteria bacterium]